MDSEPHAQGSCHLLQVNQHFLETENEAGARAAFSESHILLPIWGEDSGSAWNPKLPQENMYMSVAFCQDKISFPASISCERCRQQLRRIQSHRMFKSEHFVNGFISISLTHSTNYLLILCWEWNWDWGCQEEESVHLCLPWRCLQLSVGHTCRLQAYNSMVTAWGVVGESILPLWTSERGLRMGKELFTENLLVDQDFLRSVVWRRHSCCRSSMVSTGKRKAQPKNWELLFFFFLLFLLFFKLLFLILKF